MNATTKTLSALKNTVRAKRLPQGISAAQHVKMAIRVIALHASELDQTMNEIRHLAPKTATTKARVKELDSLLGKLVRKPAYGKATTLQDTTGMRVVCDRLDEVYSTVAAIKARFDVVGEDDYITAAKDGYRSYHLIIRSASGLEKEIQVRTVDQNTFADWSHRIYKPENDAQAAAIAAHGVEIQAYALAMSDYFHARACGLSADRPVAPVSVLASFGACV